MQGGSSKAAEQWPVESGVGRYRPARLWGLPGGSFHPLLEQAAAELLGVGAIRLWHDQALYKQAGGRPTDAHQDHPYWPITEDRTSTRLNSSHSCAPRLPSSARK